MEVTILAFLQNMWVTNPASAYGTLARNPKLWNGMVKSFLFMGCITGQRIRAAFGADLADKIIYDECTTEIADNPKTICKPDDKHIKFTIEKINPDVVVTFGDIAYKAVRPLFTGKVIRSPHPAARQPGTMAKLILVGEILKNVQYS